MARPLLFRERCGTCVFRPGNRMQLSEGRLADLIASNRRTGSMLMCHETTHRPDVARVMCRGYWDAYAATSRVPQVMTAMFGDDWYEEADPGG